VARSSHCPELKQMAAGGSPLSMKSMLHGNRIIDEFAFMSCDDCVHVRSLT
jgi:hypothetical protein